MRSRRTLRRGASGERVRWLQERLQCHGYDVGEPDGYFGYVTEDALLKFQRDCRLRADGVVGPITTYALEETPLVRRVVHVVRKGERPGDIARRYDVQLSALRWMNGLKPNAVLRPGRRITIWRPYVLVSPHRGANPDVVERSVRPYGRSISALTVPDLHCARDGTLPPMEDAKYLELANDRGWDFFVSIAGEGESLASIVTRRRSQRRLLDQLQQLDSRMKPPGESQSMRPGYLLDLGRVPFGTGSRLLSFCESLRRTLSGAVITLSIPPLPRSRRGIVTGLEMDKMARLVDWIVLGLHDWECLLDSQGNPVDFSTAERWMAKTLRQIPPWKVWLGIPMGGYHVTGDASHEHPMVTYREVMSVGLREGTRPGADDTGFLRMNTQHGSRYIVQGRNSLCRFLQLALRFKVSGLYIHSIGGEDRRLWDLFSHRVRASDPGSS